MSVSLLDYNVVQVGTVVPAFQKSQSLMKRNFLQQPYKKRLPNTAARILDPGRVLSWRMYQLVPEAGHWPLRHFLVSHWVRVAHPYFTFMRFVCEGSFHITTW